MKNNILLMGFMGCGKTSVGIALSYALQRTVLDTDKWIEQQQGKTIRVIFDTLGESAFRKMETDCLKELMASVDRKIISLGGGLPLSEENRALLKELGKVIYLKATPEVIYERLKGDASRPLLRSEDPKKKIRELLVQRQPVYAGCADMELEVSDKTQDEVVKQMIDELSKTNWLR